MPIDILVRSHDPRSFHLMEVESAKIAAEVALTPLRS
jgi:hypothetical protein